MTVKFCHHIKIWFRMEQWVEFNVQTHSTTITTRNLVLDIIPTHICSTDQDLNDVFTEQVIPSDIKYVLNIVIWCSRYIVDMFTPKRLFPDAKSEIEDSIVINDIVELDDVARFLSRLENMIPW